MPLPLPLTPEMASTSTAVVFGRLDPILKRLLEGLTALKALLPALSSSSPSSILETSNREDDREGKFVRLAQSIANELESLSRAMPLEVEFESKSNSKSNSLWKLEQQEQQRRLQHAKALCLLAKYITLPLTAIFHLPLREIYARGLGNDNNNNISGSLMASNTHGSRLQIRRSYVFRLYRLAAVAIRRFIEETTIVVMITTSTTTRNESTQNIGPSPSSAHVRRNLLPTQTWIEYLVALIQSMPIYTEITKSARETKSSPEEAFSSLDDGSDAFVAILGATNALLSCFDSARITPHNNSNIVHGDTGASSKNHPKDLTWVLLVEAWHGTLSMRLVDCLTAFLASKQSVAGSFSPQVHAAALETLLVMLQVTTTTTTTTNNNNNNLAFSSSSSSQDFWRSVFPGVFTALYQSITTNQSKSSSTVPVTLSSTSMTPLQVEIQRFSLQSLILLLTIALIKDQDECHGRQTQAERLPPASALESNNDLLARLNSMVVTANHNHNTSSNTSSKSEGAPTAANRDENKKNESHLQQKRQQEQFFFRQVRKRVEGPLVFLLRQLALSSSEDIRREVVALCKVILLETNHCWRSTPSSDKIPAAGTAETDNTISTSSSPSTSENLMNEVPLELCIGFQQDPTAAVRESAREILDAYMDNRHCEDSDAFHSNAPLVWMVPRIIELVQQLSALVHRGNLHFSIPTNEIGSDTNVATTSITTATTHTELRTHLNLLAGYLQCLDTASIGQNRMDEKYAATPKKARALNTSICNAIVSSKHLRRGLIQLFDVNLDSLSAKNGSLVSSVLDHSGKSPIKLRYLDHPELMHLAKDSVLRSLGRLLGPKHGAIFVDEVISDFMEATLQMPKANGSPSSSNLFAGWLHEWIGSLIVVREVLFGSFSVPMAPVISTSTQQESLSISKKEKRRRRILLSLASSILPLLVDCSLWNLSIDSQIDTAENTETNNSDVILSPRTLQRNQTVVVLLIELIGVFSLLLREDLQEVMVTVFYPIVEKTTRRAQKSSCDVIQQAGLSTLNSMRLSCDLESMEDLVHMEQNRLIAAMIGRLRLPGGSSIPKSRDDAEEILSVAKTLTWALEMVNRRSSDMNKHSKHVNYEGAFENDPKNEKNSAIMDLVALLNYRLDHLFLQKVLVDADVETVCSLHKAFFNYFMLIFKVKKEATYSYKMKDLEKDSKRPWLHLLSQFRKTPLETPEMDDDGDEIMEHEGRLLDIDKSDIELFAKLMGRDCYLLSYQKLQSRISSCDALTIAFKFLAFVGSEHDDPSDDKNVIRNTILRQVADSWPSIRARLKTLSELILKSYSSRSSSIVLVTNHSSANIQRGTPKPEDIGTQRIFLSKLFLLVATMCECSGDFFANRFRNDVWPAMARHLEYLLDELKRQREANSPSHVGMRQKTLVTTIGSIESSSSWQNENVSLVLSDQTKWLFKMSDTQRQLIVSILKCLNRILEQDECGKAVEKLLGSIGCTILPLLDIEGQTKIQEVSMDCMRSIMRINSDVLRRPLMELSGKLPSFPLKVGRNLGHSGENAALKLNHDSAYSISMGSKTIVHRCHELLAYAESLPEQVIS